MTTDKIVTWISNSDWSNSTTSNITIEDSFFTIQDGYSSGELETLSKQIGQNAYANISSILYELNGGSIDITVIGSPGTGSEEQINKSLTGENFVELNWNSEHKEYNIIFNLTEGSKSPKIYSVELSYSFLGDNTVSWKDDRDWEAVISSGIISENYENTDHDNDNIIKKGYSVENPKPDNPHLYYPMHENNSSLVNDLSGNGRNGNINSVSQGISGLLDTTSYSFTSTSSIDTLSSTLDSEQTFNVNSNQSNNFVDIGWFNPNNTTSISDLGFEPDFVKFYITDKSGEPRYMESIGFQDLRTSESIGLCRASGSESPNGFSEIIRDDFSIVHLRTGEDDGTGKVNETLSNISSTSSNGFTIQDNFSTDVYIQYEAYDLSGDDDISMGIVDVENDTKISKSIGFTPDFINVHSIPFTTTSYNQLESSFETEGDTDGWARGWATQDNQFAMTRSMSQENIDAHRVAAENDLILNQMWVGNYADRTHNYKAKVNFVDNGFELSPQEYNPKRNFPVVYCAYNLERDVKVNIKQRPLNPQDQDIINTQPNGGSWEFIKTHSTNTTRYFAEERFQSPSPIQTVGHNEGLIDSSTNTQFSFGLSTSSNSANNHQESESLDHIIYQYYTDQDGNIKGTDSSKVSSFNNDGATLTWDSTYNDYIGETLFAYYSFAELTNKFKAFSINAWINLNQDNNYDILSLDKILDIYYDSSSGIIAEIDPDDKNSIKLEGGYITIGDWHMITVVYDGTNSSLYIDSNEMMTKQIKFIQYQDTSLSFGLFDGKGQELKLYDKGLTQEDVQYLYDVVDKPGTMKSKRKGY